MADPIKTGMNLLEGLPVIGGVVENVRKSMPYLEEEATAEVHGKPGSKLKDLYHVALAACFGMIRRIDALQWMSPPPGMVMIEYSIEEGWVRATVKARTSLASSTYEDIVRGKGSAWSRWIVTPAIELNPWWVYGRNFINDLQNDPTPTASDTPLRVFQKPVFVGPPETINGAPWGFSGAFATGLPTTATANGAPRLEFEGRTILTRSPTCINPDPSLPADNPNVIGSPNPRPAGDNRSRGSIPIPGGNGNAQALASLVFSALTNPGSADLLTYPQPKSGPLGG